MSLGELDVYCLLCRWYLRFFGCDLGVDGAMDDLTTVSLPS